MTAARVPVTAPSAPVLLVGALLVPALLATTAVLAAPGSAASAGRRPDLDGDGRADLVMGGYHALAVLDGDGERRALTEPVPDEVSGSGFGNVTATGDFNDDGHDDVAAGDTYYGTTGGVVWILSGGPHGTLGGDGTIPVTRIEQGRDGLPGASEYGDYFGGALAAGDLTGDGVDDLAIGAMMEAVGRTENAGAVTVVPGSPDGLRPAAGRVFTQSTAGIPGSVEYNDKFGSALAVGDVTGDDRLDLAVGSEGENDKGMVHLVPGRSGGPTGAGTTSVTAGDLGIVAVEGSYPDVGSSLAVGDLTGDGRDELVVGAPYALVGRAAACGAIAVLRGASAGISAARAQVRSQSSPDVVGICEAGDTWGYSLAVGDLTGDGRPEVVVGAPVESVGPMNGGGAYTVLRPSSGGVTGTGSFGVTQNTAHVPGTAEIEDRFAETLALADIDRDGRLDVLAGAPGEITSGARAGWVGVLRNGTTGRPAASSTSVTGTAFSPAVTRLGSSLANPALP